MEKNVAKSICILGMHRSGTSAVARALNLLGVYLGEAEDMMSAKPDNPEGFWERNDIEKLHDRILNLLRLRWSTSIPLPENWYLSEDILPVKNEIIGLIEKNFSVHRLWGWKDPRTSILLPLWKNILAGMGIELSCIFVVRNPMNVVNSLKKRNDLPYDKSFGIWFNYNLTALQSSMDVHRVFVSYDRLIDNWKEELNRCSSELGIPWPDDTSLLEKEMNSFIRPDLRHSTLGMEDLKNCGAPYPVVKLYDLLQETTGSSMNQSFASKVEELAVEFSSYASFFHYDLMQLWELEQMLQEKNQHLLEMERRLKEKDNLIRHRDGQVMQKDSQIRQRDGQIKQKDEQIRQRDEQIRQRDEQIRQRDEQIQRIFNTMSWKITAPLRWLFDRVQRHNS